VGKRQLVVALWTVGILNFATNLSPIIKDQGYDTVPIWRAVHALLTHGEIYTQRGAGDFLYLPSALLMLLPLGALGLRTAKAVLFFADIGAILLSAGLLLRLFGFRIAGLAGAITLCGLSFAWPVFFTIGAGNVDALVLLGFSAFLVAASRSSRTWAGIFIGLAIALKPVLVPVLLVVALYRWWRALAAAVLVPFVLSGVVLLAAPESRDYFSHTLPLLWHGQSLRIQHVSISLSSVGDNLGLPRPATDLARLLVFFAAAVLVWRRRTSSTAEPHRLVELSTIVLVAAFLLSTFAFPFYGVYLIPFAVAAVTRSSDLHNWVTWAALFCVAVKENWHLDQLPQRLNQLLAARLTFGFLLVLVAIYLGVRHAEARRSTERMALARASPGTRAAVGAAVER
jgi:arabinofuranan 3-O-arabinosyltransferase